MVPHKNKKTLLSLDFLKHPKAPIRGAGIGLVVMVVGWLFVMSLVTLIGVIIFIPSAGVMIMKALGLKK